MDPCGSWRVVDGGDVATSFSACARLAPWAVFLVQVGHVGTVWIEAHEDRSSHSRGQLARLTTDLEAMLEGGKTLAVTVAEEDELLSPNVAADRLGFSRQHVRRLVDAGELVGRQMPGSRYWKIPLSSVLAFEDRRERAAK